VKVVVVRDKKEMTLTLTLPPPRKESSRRELLRDRDFEFNNEVDDDLDMDHDMQIDFDMPAMDHMLKAFSMAAPQIKIDTNGIVESVNSSMRDAVRRIVIDTPAGVRAY
jgi:hypothetical protein